MEQMFRFPQPDKAKTVVGMIVKDPQAFTCDNQAFFLNKLGLLSPARSNADITKLNTYLKKIMEECGKRLLELLYRPSEGDMNRKYWIGLGKRPFMGHKFCDKQYQL